MSLDVCVATSVSIQTNFKPDLLSFPVSQILFDFLAHNPGDSYMVKW